MYVIINFTEYLSVSRDHLVSLSILYYEDIFGCCYNIIARARVRETLHLNISCVTILICGSYI